MSHPAWRALLVSFGLLLTASHSLATPLPCDEDIARLKAEGKWGQMVETLKTVHGYMEGVPLSEADALGLIESSYGLPTEIKQSSRSQETGDLRVNFDGNSVIDERDVLGLGFTDLREGTAAARAASTTLPWGTGAQNNRPKCLVLLIKFTDQPPTDRKNHRTDGSSEADVNHDKDWAADKWFDLSDPATLPEMSVGWYYKKASYGKLELSGDVFYNAAVCDNEGWITSNKTYAQLAGSATYTDVMLNAIAQIDPYVDFRDYDSNGDGYLDGLITIYAGPDDFTNPDLWYFRWVDSPGMTTGDTVRIGSGLWVSEEGWNYVYCHEFGHELGLPDLYDVGDENSGDSMPGDGYWSMMSHWYVPDMGEAPPMHDAWSRMHLRWAEVVDVPTTDALTSITVNRATSASPANTIFRLWRNGQISPEYFLVEYRDAGDGLDNSLPGADGGLLIWHVNERRTSANNHNNAFNPQRLWLETADNDPPTQADNPWRSGFTGDGDGAGDGDGTDDDYFWDFSVPSAKDYSGANSGVTIDPTSAAGGASMTMDVENVSGASLPTLSWDSPADGASVSGDVLVDVTSNANSEVRYYVNGCLKKREVGSGTKNGFTWDTLTALNGSCELKAVAVNSGTGDPVRVIKRTVTVNNPQASGKGLDFTDNFNGYNSDIDPALISLWNLYEDPMTALEIGFNNGSGGNPSVGGVPGAIAFRQQTFPTPPFDGNTDDPNAGVYQGQDLEYLMTPRINLAGYSALTLQYKVAFRGSFNGEIILQTQVSDDDGANWKDLDGMTENSFTGNQYDTGVWGTSTFVQRSANLNAYINKQVYIRFLFLGGLGYNPGFALDDFALTGVALVLNSVTPARAKVGDLITLSGSGFGATQGDGAVRFSNGSGGYVAQTSVVSWNNTTITCQVPSGAATGATDGIWVYRSSVESNKKPFKVVLPAPSLGGLGQL